MRVCVRVRVCVCVCKCVWRGGGPTVRQLHGGAQRSARGDMGAPHDFAQSAITGTERVADAATRQETAQCVGAHTTATACINVWVRESMPLGPRLNTSA